MNNDMRKIMNLMEAKQPINTKLVDTLVLKLRAANRRQVWSIIDAIGWGTATTDYNSIYVALSKVYQKRKIESIGERVDQIRERLVKRIRDYEDQNGIENLFNVSDDGLWDVTAHIVGLGKAAYGKAMNDPSVFVKLDAVENFGYSFHD